MTITLRKIHLLTWVSLALAISAAMWYGLSRRPNTMYDLTANSSISRRSTLLRKADSNDWSAALYALGIDSLQVELTMKKNITRSAYIINIYSDSVLQSNALISQRGTHFYPIAVKANSASSIKIDIIDPLNLISPVSINL